MIRRSFIARTLAAIAGAVLAPFAVKAEPQLFVSRVGDPALWDIGRNSGRTTRALWEAISAAKRGETVLYVAADYEEAGRCKEIAMSLCDSGGIKCCPNVPFVLSVDRGRIRFESARSHGYKGSRCHLAVVDHAVGPERELCQSLQHSAERLMFPC